jgi:hypothetical protein
MASLDAAQAQARCMMAGRLDVPYASLVAARDRLRSMPNVTLVENSQGTHIWLTALRILIDTWVGTDEAAPWIGSRQLWSGI